jgi:uridine kinase
VVSNVRAFLGITDLDDPLLWRWDDLRRHLADLRAGRPTVVDARSRESRTAGVTRRRIEPRPVVALIGYLALHDAALADGFDVRIYIDLPETEIVRRRRQRHAHRRTANRTCPRSCCPRTGGSSSRSEPAPPTWSRACNHLTSSPTR